MIGKSTIVIAVLLCISSVTCWWEIGHMTVAQIAEKRLKTIGEAAALDKFNQLVKAFSSLTDGRSNTFV